MGYAQNNALTHVHMTKKCKKYFFFKSSFIGHHYVPTLNDPLKQKSLKEKVSTEVKLDSNPTPMYIRY